MNRSRLYQRRERTNLVLAALTFALILCATIFGLLAQCQSNTGAALGHAMVSGLSIAVALGIILDRSTQ